MKKFLLSIVSIAIAATFAYGQSSALLPCDPEVKTGKLDNGMTYYIRHNALPEGRCEFYLCTNVGAIQETPDQSGLAHFLEHMCFNGLKNLPGKQMLDYLQHIGAEFGRNINASTGVEQTQYMLNNIPVSREGILDTCLLVMHDYSHFVLNEAEEIDDERGVILEEKRTRNNAHWRMFEKSLPYLYGDCKYATCNIIGSEENLKTFKPSSLRTFYETWYQPDMQALVVVGDIDVEQVYGKVVKLFSDIPAPATPTVKQNPLVPVNEEPVVGIITDPENTSTTIEFIWKLGEPMPKELRGTIEGYVTNIFKRIIGSVMYERFEDITSKADAPFLHAGFGIGSLCETCEVCDGSLICDNAKTDEAITVYMTEIEKMRRYGFTDAEVNRVKDDILKSLKDKVQNASARKNPEFISPIINHFFHGYAYMAPETDLQLTQMLLSQLNAEAINQMLKQVFTGEHFTAIYMGIDKEGQVHPTKEHILEIIEGVKKSDIQPNAAEIISSDFLAGNVLKGGKIKKETVDGDTYIWTLSNGLRVVVKPTEYKKDQVLLNLRKTGGKTTIPTEDLETFDESVLSIFGSCCGIGQFPSSTVSKMLSGKNVNVWPYLSSEFNGISGSCSPEDIETALQLMYLEFVQPRFDEEEWGVAMNQLGTLLPNAVSTPNYVLNKHLLQSLYNNPRATITSATTLEKASLETYAKYYRMLFNNVAGATLYIVGNVDMQTLKPLVAKYCGSLPKAKKAAKINLDNVLSPVKGEISDVFTTAMTTPKASVVQIFSGDAVYTVQKAVNLKAAEFILDMIYTETLREQEGGTYGAQSRFNFDYYPKQQISLQTYFDTNIEQQESLRALAIKGLKNLAENGPTDEQLTRAIENAKKNLPEKRITNSYWMSVYQHNDLLGTDYDTEYEAAVNNITAEGVKAAVKEIVDQNNFVEVVMLPELPEAE